MAIRGGLSVAVKLILTTTLLIVLPPAGPVVLDVMPILRAAAAAGKHEVLIKFDIAAGGSRYRVFAYPVFSGAPATAAGAIAPEPPDQRQGYVVLGYDLAPIDWFSAAAAEQKATASTRAALY